MYTALITGGLGYIGSHICREFLLNNYNIIIVDNLSNSKINKLDVIHKYKKNNAIHFYKYDITNFELLNEIFENHTIDIVVHLAGYKSVNESIVQPNKYFRNNLISTMNLIDIMNKHNCNNLIFSSSATVYGTEQVPYFEHSQTGIGITNAYGRSKFIQEEMLYDIAYSNPKINIIILRYFNPIGSLNKEFAEEPNGVPNNLFPYIVKVYNNELPYLNIFGNNYSTRDGTCTRDFIHVLDLANAHLVCSNHMLKNKIGLKIYNVGTGKDTSVLELINAFEKVNNVKLNYKITDKRNGDIERSYSNTELIFIDLGWKAKYDINDCVKI